MDFGKKLIELRKSHGVGRRKLNELTGLSLSYLHEIENDVFLPGIDKLDLIADKLELTVEEREQLQREREEAELERLGFEETDITLLLKDRKEPLPEDAKERIVEILNEVRKKERRQSRTKKGTRSRQEPKKSSARPGARKSK